MLRFQQPPATVLRSSLGAAQQAEPTSASFADCLIARNGQTLARAQLNLLPTTESDSTCKLIQGNSILKFKSAECFRSTATCHQSCTTNTTGTATEHLGHILRVRALFLCVCAVITRDKRQSTLVSSDSAWRPSGRRRRALRLEMRKAVAEAPSRTPISEAMASVAGTPLYGEMTKSQS